MLMAEVVMRTPHQKELPWKSCGTPLLPPGSTAKKGLCLLTLDMPKSDLRPQFPHTNG